MRAGGLLARERRAPRNTSGSVSNQFRRFAWWDLQRNTPTLISLLGKAERKAMRSAIVPRAISF